jgi:murein DD-endopeptidase MepM/ murein hydrolase activator NlpD
VREIALDPVSSSGGTAAPADAARRELREAAAAFEALFLQTLIRRMREAQLEGGLFGEGAGASIHEGLFYERLSERLAGESPLGIAKMLEAQWAGAAPSGVATEAPTELRRRESVRAYAAAAQAPPAREADLQVSSHYGWRRDPIDGRRRFHAGVDLPAPVGTPVLAPATGRVLRVGHDSGYGLQIVVEHAAGWTTRYAHLSAATVRVGDGVFRGQEIGRVGRSGRSTGPHLHVETARNGVRVDPRQALGGRIAPQVLARDADGED